MADETLISWADMTFNPWIGCTRISPACDGCYAAHLMETRMGRVQWGGPGVGAGTRERTSAANWRKPIAWNNKAKAEGRRPFVFCSSLADVFDNEVPAEWRRDLFELIDATPIRTYMPETLPADEDGRIHFARALAEAAADAIEAVLATTEGSDNG